MRKIIFLDLDGVLNSEDYASEEILVEGKETFRGYGGHFREKHIATLDNVLWDPKCVSYLKRIVEASNAQIVISSTWRHYFSVKKFKEMFALYGWTDAPVIDKTIELGKYINDGTCRGLEINEWLSRNTDVTSYVIIDDIPQFLTEQNCNFINTDFQTGLSEEDILRALIILKSDLTIL